MYWILWLLVNDSVVTFILVLCASIRDAVIKWLCSVLERRLARRIAIIDSRTKEYLSSLSYAY